MKKRGIVLSVLLVLIILLMVFATDNTLRTTEYVYTSEKIPEPFHGYRIAQVSDLHNDDLGDPEILLQAMEQARPDLIVITGDMIDANRTDVKTALHFAERFTTIAPTYFINGNHEWVSAYGPLSRGLKDRGVIILEDASVPIERKDAFFHLAGVVDPFLASRYLTDRLATTLPGDGVFTILLSHRPERLEAYAQAGADLVFTGHAHGGQFRLPFVGPLYAPHQGWFPAYAESMHTLNNTTMVVSRGIGNSIFPLRLNNPPELVIVELQTP